ncbi:MAG: hypothetical protein BAJALOKI2v1_30087 [Promethearchaeota archaeon]|nr:MAG: hypothetical protein BAJALOKI2v1_30087 [Candidatus Lokiarchaeota archaeon]
MFLFRIFFFTIGLMLFYLDYIIQIILIKREITSGLCYYNQTLLPKHLNYFIFDNFRILCMQFIIKKFSLIYCIIPFLPMIINLFKSFG